MAVYTEVFDDDLSTFVQQYDIGKPIALKGIAEGVENSNFLLVTDRSTFILTLYERRVVEADLPYFLGLLRHVAQAGLPCPQPVAALDGGVLRRLNGRPAAVFTFLNGASPHRPTADQCAQVGGALARLHLAGLSYGPTRPNALSVGGWGALFDDIRDRADTVLPGLKDELQRELAFLGASWPTDLPSGVIHADLFPDNVFFLDGQLSGLIDFYFACNDFFAYDLCICLNAWCFENEREFNVTKARNMIDSYRKVRPLGAGERAALPLLARGAALRFLLTRVYDRLNAPEGALVTLKDPAEYLHKLRFHQATRDVSAWGVSL